MTVDVPPSRLVEVYAQASFGGADRGAVGLFLDGAQMAGQGPNCGDTSGLLSNGGTNPLTPEPRDRPSGS